MAKELEFSFVYFKIAYLKDLSISHRVILHLVELLVGKENRENLKAAQSASLTAHLK